MHRYDETRILRMLEGLTAEGRTVFALLCATRMLPAYRRFHTKTGQGDAAALEHLAHELWLGLGTRQTGLRGHQDALSRCMGLIPSEDDGWDEETQPYAEDAASALAYAIRARISEDPQEAAWAARRVYDAVDHYACAALGGRRGGVDDELAISSHSAVQRELARQHRDLAELRQMETAGTLQSMLVALRRRAESEGNELLSSP